MLDLLGKLVEAGGIGYAISLAAMFAILRGRLIPRSWHREVVERMDKALGDKDKTIAEQSQQIAILLGRDREPRS